MAKTHKGRILPHKITENKAERIFERNRLMIAEKKGWL